MGMLNTKLQTAETPPKVVPKTLFLLFLTLCSLSLAPIFAQRVTIADKQNKFGLSLIVVPQAAIEIQSNNITGQKTKKRFNALGAELFYERLRDVYFGYGFSIMSFAPTNLTIDVPYAYLSAYGVNGEANTENPGSPERYKAKLTSVGVGLYLKTYIRPVKTAGWKPYLAIGANYVQGTLALNREPNTQSPEPAKVTINHGIVMRYAGVGGDYVMRSGLGLRAAIRILGGFDTKAFDMPASVAYTDAQGDNLGEDQTKKLSTYYLDMIPMIDLGAYFFF